VPGSSVLWGYFEYGNTRRASIFSAAKLDVAVLEVGLGRKARCRQHRRCRCRVVTSVDLDHVDYLGPTREDVGREKAGIFRAARPVVWRRSGSSVVASSRTRGPLGARIVQLGRDYGYVAQDRQWQ
jgi:dihydrofolate synthase/folylpolyglutamate synthase